MCLFTFRVPFKRLFSPFPEVGCLIFFLNLESLGKSSGKKWSQILTFLFGSGLKSPKKKFFFGLICLTKHGGNHTSQWIRDLWSKGVLLILAYFKTFLIFCVLDDFFSVFHKILVLGYSWSNKKWWNPRFPMD